MKALDVLKKYFKYPSFRGTQSDVIERLLDSKHALVIMPTGMGKSLCYQIPALMQDGLTLVISPLIALMKDQVDGLLARDIDAAFINSSLSKKERETRYRNIKDGKYKLLYVTPERFRKKEFVEVVTSRQIDLLAVDEAHCISHWGHDFRPDYTRLREFRKLLGDPTTVALTATATPEVQEDIIRQLGLQPDAITLFHEGINRPNLSLEVEDVWSEDEKLEHIIRIQKANPGSGICYFTLIKTLEVFSEYLTKRKIEHLIYHGELGRTARRDIQESFMQGTDNLVLATNAFGMGIDKEDIRFVTHVEIPSSMEAYYQEIGRAGRDGKPSVCTLLYQDSDLTTQMEFMKWSNPDADYYDRVYQMLSTEMEKVNAFGMEWLVQQIHHKQKYDHRLETVLGMLDRYGVIEGSLQKRNLSIVRDLPEDLHGREYLAEKLKRDQLKLLALVKYAKHDGDRKAFIHEYFGLPYEPLQ